MEFFMSNRQKFIVSADDFGISPLANRNILELVELGKIDRVGVMAHGNFSNEEIREILESGVKMDIHLDILHEFHENRRERERTFLRLAEFLGKLFSGQLTAKRVGAQWEKQMEKFREIFGKSPDGINSHEHVHFFPLFFKIALKLQDKYSIPYVRFGDSIFKLHNKSVAHILHWLRIINYKRFKKSGCVSSGSLVSLDWIKDMNKFIKNLSEGNVEIICHPEIPEEMEKIRKYF
jgi:predicted glycoside hydrolase/deacetylase ChbG (UPF0249 family)